MTDVTKVQQAHVLILYHPHLRHASLVLLAVPSWPWDHPNAIALCYARQLAMSMIHTCAMPP
jgi:hypothetical protein